MQEQMSKLTNVLHELEEATDFETGRIVLFISDEHFAIDIDGKDWSNYLTYDETMDELVSLFRGIALGKGKEWRYIE